MINETTLCRVAKKLHNIKPGIIIDDPMLVEEMLRKWWDDFINDRMTDYELTGDDDKALSQWIRDYLSNKLGE